LLREALLAAMLLLAYSTNMVCSRGATQSVAPQTP
jgi:hypothetical protein